MSILSALKKSLAAGTPPLQALSTAWTQIEAWGEQVVSKAPAAVLADVNQAVTDVKAAASAVVGEADSLAVPIITTAAAAAGAAFTAGVTAYLGPVAAAALTPAGLDAIAAIKNGIISELNALELEMQAALAGTVSGTPVPNPVA